MSEGSTPSAWRPAPTSHYHCQPRSAVKVGPGPIPQYLLLVYRPPFPSLGSRSSSALHLTQCGNQPSALTPASENQPPEGSPHAGRRGSQEAGQVDSFCQQPAEVGHGGEMGGGHRDLAQYLWARDWVLQSWDTGAPPKSPYPSQAPSTLAVPEGMQ